MKYAQPLVLLLEGKFILIVFSDVLLLRGWVLAVYS
jgi:hypothetical protein